MLLLLQTNFNAFIHNLHNLVTPPVLTPIRMSEPQLVFTPSGSEILGFDLNNGTLVKQLKPPRARKINALVQRPNCPEFYSASAGGKITSWVPEVPEAGEGGEEGEDKKTYGLDTIYQNLARTPIHLPGPKDDSTTPYTYSTNRPTHLTKKKKRPDAGKWFEANYRMT